MPLFKAENTTLFVQDKIAEDISNLEKICKLGDAFFSHTFKDGNPDREPADSDIDDRGDIAEFGFDLANRANLNAVYLLELYDPRYARDFYVYFIRDNQSFGEFHEEIEAEFASV